MQVFTNIVDNAIKYAPVGGSVEVRGASKGDQIIVEIEDTGTGIHPEEISRIFERFYQVDKSRSGGGRGTGLGLSIANEIIQAHGGSIDVKSQMGIGSCFKVKIPVVEIDELTGLNHEKRKSS